jgi:uncharacterized protein (DUF2141 family)
MNIIAITIAAALAAASTSALASTAGTETLATAATASTSATLTVTYTGMTERSGTIMFVLFDSEAAYDGRGAPVRAEMVPVSGDNATVTIAGLAPGTYAIKAFHDLDDNHDMTVNPYGMPTEPFAFSNNAQGRMGPAVWADAQFTVGADGATQTITID